jgi:hypothetical protein
VAPDGFDDIFFAVVVLVVLVIFIIVLVGFEFAFGRWDGLFRRRVIVTRS